MTVGQQAFADGFAATLATHGQTWTRTSDSAAIQAVPGNLKDLTPHLIDGPLIDFPIIIASSALQPVLTAAQVMPTTPLRTGDELTKGGKHYRVTLVDFREASGTYKVTISSTP
jgi:hypothetical protein